ncbi:amidase [Rhizoctonia solani AG-1 IA]|uniref:Amidase n=1 Tax=Thanatephorus cucumeris (strain AG1-IA) TaxID=983506 RepID=L8WTB0_THACA|nr:amidase [Rhizoctonia solani AG-1 IA]
MIRCIQLSRLTSSRAFNDTVDDRAGGSKLALWGSYSPQCTVSKGRFVFSYCSHFYPCFHRRPSHLLPAPRRPNTLTCTKHPSGSYRTDWIKVTLQAYFARIDEVNLKGPKLRAVIELNPQAIAQAAALDAERKRTGKRSPLHGIPILLKDNIATLASEGMNTTAGSYALLKSVVPGDATVAAKLRKAGAVLLGKANLSEWANIRGTFISASGWSAVGGQATNPYYPAADPCGSSSGSGVATAIGLAAGSLGTETDGSIICPSSYNNLVGVKPTVGLTSREGVVPISSHQDTVGPMTRSVADAAVILSIIAGRDKKDNYTQTAPSKIPDYTQFLDVNAIKGKRFGVPRAVFTDDSITGNHPSINAEFNKSLDIIRSLGGIVVDPADLPDAHEIPDMGLTRFQVDLNKYLKSLKSIPTKTGTLEKIIQFNDAYKGLEQPKGYEGQTMYATSGYNSTYYDALRENYKLGRQRGIDGALKSYKLDALLLPSNGTRNSTSFEIHDALNALVLGYTTTPAAIAGYPIVTVPLGFHPDDTHVESAGPYTVFPAPGVPFGLSFLGTAYSETSLIGFAYAYEQRTHTRLKRLAYKDAIPKTQLQDIIL